MSLVGNLLRKISYKASGGILGTASGEKPGTSGTPVNNNSYQNPISQGLDDFNKVANKGFTISPMVIAAGFGMILLAFFLFKSPKK